MEFSLDLTALTSAYRDDTWTPLDVVDRIAARMAATPHAGVFIHQPDHEQLRGAARALMARRARGDSMRLYGIPFAVKDNIDVAGLPTTAACPAYGHVAEQSAACVARLLAEGALLIGKTNLDQFATGLVGVRTPYGIPANPFGAAYVPGGSSSGSAVAVARGFCSFALATDTAGSGRVPAGFNNLVGLKPTRGMISAYGVVPACRSLDCVAVFAPSVADAAEIAHVLAGFDPRDPYARPEATHWDPRPGEGELAPFRFGVPLPSQLELSAPYAATDFARAAQRLSQLGGRACELDFSVFAQVARLLYGGPFVAERLEAAGALLERDADAIDPTVRGILASARPLRAVDLFRAQHALEQLRTQAARLLQDVDCLLVPTAPTLPRIEDVQAEPIALNSKLGTYTNFVNLLDMCALAVPAGFTAGGLPFGVTLIAPRGEDRRLARIGRAFASAAALQPERPIGTNAPGASGDSPPPSPPSRGGGALLAVVGAHLSGQPLNRQLTERGAQLVRSTRTAARYRLFALPTTPAKPGLVRVSSDEPGHAIEVEVWRLDDAALGSFLQLVADPLCIGTLELQDGCKVLGFLCEAVATRGQPDISSFGGWRAYLDGRR